MQNQPNTNQTHVNRSRTLWQSLRTGWKAFARFMVHPPQVFAQLESNSSYYRDSAKARFYAYLPPSEEQRDWLDKIYHQS
ncbi:MAG: hypothetical protein AAF215_24420 [Cyanobacteria bacterium P01_A01_bin.123]